MASFLKPAITTDFIGRGWAYPFQFDPRTGGVAKDVGYSDQQKLQRVLWSIQQILGVQQGELFFGRTFGSTIRTLIFKPNDAGLQTLLEFAVTQAIEQWERRVRLTSVDITQDPSTPTLIQIRATYTLAKTNVTGNLVYPLFLNDNDRLTAVQGPGGTTQQ